MKALKGINDTLTYKDACDLGDKLLTEYLYYLHSVIEAATDDDEERSNINVNLADRLTKVLNMHMTMGALKDPDIWLDEIRSSLPEGIRNEVKLEIVEVDDDYEDESKIIEVDDENYGSEVKDQDEQDV